MPARSRTIHERFIRHIWSRQYLHTASLVTADGRTVEVIDPGALNSGSGADFSGARIRIGGVLYTGDVEIHRTAADWLRHGHPDSPRYDRVILHVVLQGERAPAPAVTKSGRVIPVLFLEAHLNESLRNVWQKTILDERAVSAKTIPCSNLNKDIDAELLSQWLRKLALRRLELKLRTFEERLHTLAMERRLSIGEMPRTYGEPPLEGSPDEVAPPDTRAERIELLHSELWEQILYEGIMEALGYQHNREPFLQLARRLPLDRIREHRLLQSPLRTEAALFGAAGLLAPLKPIREREANDYLDSLQQEWKALQFGLGMDPMDTAAWNFFPTRPANFPTIRIAAAAALLPRLADGDFFRSLIQAVKQQRTTNANITSLRALFHAEASPFWRRHHHFHLRTERPVTAAGTSRINDIIINVVLPVALLYARSFKDKQVREGTLALYEHFPPLSENSITRLMQQQLFKKRVPLDTVARQQGAIQLFKFYCSEQQCGECEVGKVTTGFIKKNLCP